MPRALLLCLVLVALLAPAAHAKTPACFGAASRDAAKPCDNPALATKATPKPDDAILTPNAPCRPIRAKQAPKTCWFGTSAKRSRDTVALLGDSHAPAWRAALEPIAKARRWHAITVFRSSCPFTALRPLPGPGTESSCEPFLTATQRWFKRHPEVHTVFLGLSAAYDWKASGFDANVDGIQRALVALPPTVKRIVVLRDSPRATEGTLDCVGAALQHKENPGQACALDRATSLLPDAAAQATGPRIEHVDLSDAFCDETHCFPVIGGALVYKDVSHMTAAFARTLAPQLSRALR